MPPLSITSRTQEDTVTLTVTGEIDLGNAESLYKALTDALAPGGPVIVDLTEVGFIDSRGLSALVRARHEAVQADQAGPAPILLVPSDPVARLLELAGTETILPVYPDRSAARAALTGA
jgi:anti-anti-sigma factor